MLNSVSLSIHDEAIDLTDDERNLQISNEVIPESKKYKKSGLQEIVTIWLSDITDDIQEKILDSDSGGDLETASQRMNQIAKNLLIAMFTGKSSTRLQNATIGGVCLDEHGIVVSGNKGTYSIWRNFAQIIVDEVYSWLDLGPDGTAAAAAAQTCDTALFRMIGIIQAVTNLTISEGLINRYYVKTINRQGGKCIRQIMKYTDTLKGKLVALHTDLPGRFARQDGPFFNRHYQPIHKHLGLRTRRRGSNMYVEVREYLKKWLNDIVLRSTHRMTRMRKRIPPPRSSITSLSRKVLT